MRKILLTMFCVVMTLELFAASGRLSANEKAEPLFRFKQEILALPLGTSYHSMVTYLEKSSDITSFTWSFEPEGASPADGIKMVGSYLSTVKDGDYLVKATFAGNDKYMAAEAVIKVISGAGAPAGKVVPQFAFVQNEYNIGIGQSVSVAVSSNLPSGTPVSYGVTPSDGLTVSNDGVCTAQSVGVYTVTASFAGDEAFEAATATTTVNVSEAPVKQDPVFGFRVESIDTDTQTASIDLRKYMDIATDLQSGKIIWSFRAVDSPADGITLTYGYLTPKANGTYVVSAVYPGDDTYEAKTATVTVYVGPKSGDPLTGKVTPVKTIPATGGIVSTSAALEKIVITFPPKGDDGIDAVDRSEGVYLTLSRGDQVIDRIPTSDRSRFYISANNYSEMNVIIPKITETGHYTLKVPANIITFQLRDSMAVGADDGNEEELTPQEEYQLTHNAELNIYFDVIYTPDFSISPAVGRVKAEELRQIVLTYPEGTVVEQSTDAMSTLVGPALYYFDEAVIEGQEVLDADGNGTGVYMHQKTRISDYGVTYEGNKVILDMTDNTEVNPSPANTTVKYYYVAIPKGYWIAKYNGISYPVLGQNIEKYSVIDETIPDINTEEAPHLQVPENSEVSLEEMSILKLSYPETYTFNAWSESNPMGKKIGYAVGSLRKVADASETYGTVVGDYILTDIDEQERVLTLALTDKNDAEIEKGIYCVGIGTNLFELADKSKSGLIYFKGFDITPYRLPTLVIDVEDEENAREEVKWYDLQGSPVVAPAKGIFIRVVGGKATKVVL